MRLPLSTTLLALAAALSWPAPSVRADDASCAATIARETADRLFATLHHPLAEADCAFVGVRTRGHLLEARWSAGGTELPPITVVPSACRTDAPPGAEPFEVDVPPGIAARCPSTAPLIVAFVAQVRRERPLIDREVGSLRDPLFRGARVLFASIALALVALVIRRALRSGASDARWVRVGVVGFVTALALRAALPFSIGNWYAGVLPAVGPPPWMRFGPGIFAFESLLRDAGSWSPTALAASHVVLGALAVPLLLAVLHELDVELRPAAATLVFFALSPFHARLSATSSEHVLASTLCLGLLLAGLRAFRTGDRLWLVLAALLFPAVCATRVDMAVQATFACVLPSLRDPVERAHGLRGRPLHARVAVLGVVVAATLALAYRFIVLPSHHPLPDAADRMLALRLSLPQFWILAKAEPHWIPMASVVFAVPGAAVMAARRPWLLARVVGLLLVAFVSLGRTFLHDQLVGARYFLFVLPIALIPAGFGFAACLEGLPARIRERAFAPALVVLAFGIALGSRAAFTARYAFQDEYGFARRALAQLPDRCVVYEVPVRSTRVPYDVDCCLDVDRSPLVLDFPRLRFRDLPADVATVFDEPGCVAYFESVACAIPSRTGPWRDDPRALRAAAYFAERCAAVRSVGQLEPIARSTTSVRSTNGFFDGRRPHVSLHRWYAESPSRRD